MELRALAFVLISDLDDTIKISNSERKLITVYRGLFRDSAFTGMADLYRELLSNSSVPEDQRFLLLTSSPPQIARRVERFMRKHGFPPARTRFRDWLRDPSIIRYKLKSLTEEVVRAPAPVILVGDNTEHDPAVFAHLKEKFPEKILTQYIHLVSDKPIREGQVPFYTAFDFACAELAAGRLSNDQVLRIGEAVLKAEKQSWIIPHFSVKPPLQFLPFFTVVDQAITEVWERIRTKLEELPKRRK